MGLTLAIAVPTVALLVALLLDGRRRDGNKQQALELMMGSLVTAKGRGTLDEIALIVGQNKHVLGRYHARSSEFRAAGAYAEAAQWIQHGCEAIEKLAPGYVAALRSLRRMARSASVIVALPPVRAYAYRSWQLRGLAGLGTVLHNVLVTGQERMRLRLRVLTYAFGLSVRWLRRSSDRVVLRPSVASNWAAIDNLVFDLAVTGDETLLSAERIVQAVDALELGMDGRSRKQSIPGSVGLP